jgi:Tol biopolymer transport system component
MLLPDGDSVLFSSTTTGDWDRAQIVVQSLSTNKRTVILDGGSDARYVPTGHLVYARGDSLFAVAFDPSRLAVSGKPVELVKGVMRAASNATAAANYGVSNDGTLVYVSGKAGGGNALVWVDRNGGEDRLALKPCLCYYPALSPDGTRVAVSQITPGENDGDIWVWSLTQQTFTRLTFGGDLKTSPLWTPDGKRIVYRSPKGLFWLLADGTGDIQQLIEGSDFEPFGWTTDGQLIFTHPAGGILDIGELSVEGERKQRVLLAAKFDEGRPALSPDGRWLAYQSNESGRSEIYVRPFPNLEGGKWQLSEGGGEEPRWTQDGRTLFFLGPKNLMATTVEAAAEFSFRPPQSVLERAKYYFPGGPRQYGLSPDAQRLLLIKAALVADPDQAPPRIVVVTNWFEELKRLVPTK